MVVIWYLILDLKFVSKLVLKTVILRFYMKTEFSTKIIGIIDY